MNNDSKTPRTFLCTRPRLAAYLQNLGYEAVIMPHPWRPGLTAWQFTIDRELAQVVAQYYAQQDINPPAAITEELQRGTENE